MMEVDPPVVGGGGSASEAGPAESQPVRATAVEGEGEWELPGNLIDPDIDVELVRPPAVSERYYQGACFFCNIKDTPSHDQFVLQHSNGLCVIGVAASHPLRDPAGPKVTAVVFRKDLLSNKPSGKKKIGASWMNELSPLCDVTCDDGSTYVLYACVRGNMYEVNRRLVDHPELIATLGDTEGYIAIIMPKRDEKKTATEKLLTQAQYNSRPPFPNALVNAVGVQE